MLLRSDLVPNILLLSLHHISLPAYSKPKQSSNVIMLSGLSCRYRGIVAGISSKPTAAKESRRPGHSSICVLKCEGWWKFLICTLPPGFLWAKVVAELPASLVVSSSACLPFINPYQGRHGREFIQSRVWALEITVPC